MQGPGSCSQRGGGGVDAPSRAARVCTSPSSFAAVVFRRAFPPLMFGVKSRVLGSEDLWERRIQYQHYGDGSFVMKPKQARLRSFFGEGGWLAGWVGWVKGPTNAFSSLSWCVTAAVS